MESVAEKLLLWEQRIKERIEIGMKVDEWCLKNNISKNQYYYWNHKLNEKQKLDEEVIFADVTPNLSKPEVAIQNSASCSEFQIFINGIQVTVPSNFNTSALTGLIKVLKAL